MTTTTEVYLPRAEIIDIVTKRDGYQCYLCPAPFSEQRGMEMTLDHVLPLSRGGTWVVDNIKFAHRKCNQEKADRIFLEDGSLEPREIRLGYAQRKQNKEQILANFCELCENGRMLMPEEYCPDCFRGATQWPQTMKRTPSECSHSGFEWCWLEAIEPSLRRPAIETVLDVDYPIE
jgi:HNH endonuclease